MQGKDKITFNDFKAYRKIMTPILCLNKWRSSRRPSKFWSNVRLTAFIVGAVLIGSCKVVHAQAVDLDTIASIESDHDTHAYNFRTGAVGEFQILPGVVQDYNESGYLGGGIQLTIEQMYSEYYSHLVADWYLNVKIPSYLKHYGIPDTVTSRLISYNWGIGHLRKWFKRGCHWNQLPAETRGYIKKYYERK